MALPPTVSCSTWPVTWSSKQESTVPHVFAGLAKGTLNQFKDSESKKTNNFMKMYYVLYEQASLMSRRKATRTCTSLHQVEMMTVFTHSLLNVPRRKRSVYKDPSAETYLCQRFPTSVAGLCKVLAKHPNLSAGRLTDHCRIFRSTRFASHGFNCVLFGSFFFSASLTALFFSIISRLIYLSVRFLRW